MNAPTDPHRYDPPEYDEDEQEMIDEEADRKTAHRVALLKCIRR